MFLKINAILWLKMPVEKTAAWCVGFVSCLSFGVTDFILTGYQPHGSLLMGSVCLGFCSVPQTPLHPKGSGILFKLCMDSEPSAFCETNLGS
jgi:hypothetical protein